MVMASPVRTFLPKPAKVLSFRVRFVVRVIEGDLLGSGSDRQRAPMGRR
jgi:hypothetical protein